MYQCEDCGNLFDQTILVHDYEQLEHFGYPCRVSWDGCPQCYSDNYIEVIQCNSCGEWVNRFEIEEGLCYKCAIREGIH